MSEASQYQAIRRYWKKRYRVAQGMQQKLMQAVRTGEYPEDYWFSRGQPMSESARNDCKVRAWRYQADASEMMDYLNKYKEPAVGQ